MVSDNFGNSFIKDLIDINHSDYQQFGRKAVSLAILLQHGILVPKGFCISDQMLRCMFATNNLSSLHEKNSALEQDFLFKKILQEILILFGDWEYKKKLVVRSSASLEDSVGASYAGIFRSEINIDNQILLFAALRSCWESQYFPHVKKYSALLNENINNLYLGSIIQEMVEGDVSGVVFTKNPINPAKNELIIEAFWGQCGPIVQGSINPDRFYIDRGNNKIIRYDQSTENQDQGISKACLTENDLKTLIDTSLLVENIFSAPQDIEWTMKNHNIFILQSRPITNIH